MESYIADNIMREYKKEKRVKMNKKRLELDNFIKKNCINCKNKHTDLCHIVKNISNELSCSFKKN